MLVPFDILGAIVVLVVPAGVILLLVGLVPVLVSVEVSCVVTPLDGPASLPVLPVPVAVYFVVTPLDEPVSPAEVRSVLCCVDPLVIRLVILSIM